MKTLKHGDRGSAVQDYQTQLQCAGYNIGDAGADGWFWHATLAATLKFQADHKLLTDGVVGPRTLAALASSLPPVAPPVATGDFAEIHLLTPNRGVKGNRDAVVKCDYLVLHHTDGWSRYGGEKDGDVAHCMNPATAVSYHTLVAWNGTRTVLVPDGRRAWHAGASSWAGRNSCNEFTMGLAFGGSTITGMMRPGGSKLLTPPELASALEWIRPRARKYGWRAEHIITHAMIAPGRKADTSAAVCDQVRRVLVG
ncbi:MAG: N-acetylmuramoyl-L-alanine amidase [Chthoniobacterales bacterium]|nr:N-acetylmuramoyl-L-alanine amidase [Chthoniobacterales bacterium]